ncbi:MAG TPA: tRNA lysidine(34) synthetase TilS [Anaerolineae bacterium]|nr:tRNA lysidine(34) synthetase TilS [Anaerolineae bacterium]
MVLERVRKAILQQGLLEPGARVVAGVSGGPDSLCLLHVLTRLAPELGLALHVAHLDHRLRGPESAADAAYVAKLAGEWGLPCTVEQADVSAIATDRHLAVEEAARRARYAFLARVAVATGSMVIVVGHNADDQAETVLMHFLRGSGLAGLRGMLPRARLGDYRLLEEAGAPAAALPELWLVRPLLEVSRSDILAYCANEGLQPRFDRSNLDTTLFRNWLRHRVLPLLSEHNPRVREVLCRSAQVLADEHALVRSLLDEAWEGLVAEEAPGLVALDLAAWRRLPAAVQRSSLREAIHRLRWTLRDIGFVHVEDALRVAQEGPTGRQATLPQGLMLRVEYDRLVVGEAVGGASLPDWPLLDPDTAPVPVVVPGQTRLPGGWVLEASLVPAAGLPPAWDANPDPWLAYVAWPEPAGVLWLRTRQPGDCFCPLGMGGQSVRLAGWLTNQKVPRAARSRIPLLVGEPGIVWVCGQRFDERARVGTGTERVLVLRFWRE